MRSIKTCLGLLLFSVVLSISANCAEQVKFVPYDTWYGYYMGSLKLGYEHIYAKRTTLEGQEVYCIVDNTVIQLGSDMSINSTQTFFISDKFQPIRLVEKETDTDKGASSDKTIEAKFTPKTIECKITTDKVVTHKSIAIPKNTDFTSECKFRLHTMKLAAGMKIVLCGLDTDDLILSKSIKSVTKRDKIQANGKSYDTFVVESDEDKTWCLVNCTQIKSEQSETHGICVIEEPEKAADVAKSTISITSGIKVEPEFPANAFIEDLTVRIYGLQDNTLAVSDGTQTAKYLPADNTIEYHTSSRTYDVNQAITLPIKGKEFTKWLSDSKGIEVSDKSIQTKAHEIVGDETNALAAAIKLKDWVSKNMNGAYATQIPLSAVEILKAKSGDCKHYARLYTALARAAGIPTREVTGLACGSIGSFYGHEWAESYVGTWIPIDAAFVAQRVDATHIKLANSDDEKQSDRATISLVGMAELKAKVISYTALVMDENGKVKTVKYPSSEQAETTQPKN